MEREFFSISSAMPTPVGPLMTATLMSAGAAVVAVMMVLAAGAGPRGFFALSVGDAVAMTAYVLAVFEPLEALGMEIQTIQAAAAAWMV